MQNELKTINDEIKLLRSDIARRQAEFAQIVSSKFHENVKWIFAKHPQLESVFWTQYTDFFNDGDPCNFCVHETHHLRVDDENACDHEGSSFIDTDLYNRYKEAVAEWIKYELNESAWIADYNIKNYPSGPPSWAGKPKPHYLNKADLETEISFYENNKEFFSDLTEVYKLIDTIDDDTKLQLYGDHVQVTITASGIETEEYDHD